MKKYSILYVASLALASALSSCYEDKSTFAGQPIEAVEIDTTGMGENNIYIGYQETLNLAPKLKSAEGKNLSYQWSISEKTDSERDTTMKVIGNELELNYKVERPINTSFYRLRLIVTDHTHSGLQSFCSWNVHVQSAFISGLLVAESKDGATTDFTYIKNKNFTPKYSQEEKIFRNILSGGTAGAIQGLVSSLHYSSLGRQWSTHTPQVWATTTEGKVMRYKTLDYTVNGNSDETNLIPYKPSGFKFNFFFKAFRNLFACTSHGNYSLVTAQLNIFSLPDPIIGTAKFKDNVVAVSPDSYATYDNAVWVEESTGAFASYTYKLQGGMNEVGSFNATANVFDPNQLSDKKVLAGENSHDKKTSAFLMQDNATQEYAVYQLNLGTSTAKGYAKGLFRIPSSFKTTMDNAVSCFFNKKENILYVATETAVYSVTYGSGDEAQVSSNPIYSLPEGEKMQKAKLFIQGQYMADAGEIRFLTELAYNLNALILISNKNGQGVVRVVPLTQNGTSADTGNAHTYDGFSKVLDVISVGQ